LNRFRHPEGTRLPALEKNILKYRAFEMILLLFYAEYLKDILVGSIQASDRFRNGVSRIKASTKNKFKVATAALVADGILTKEENQELIKLVNFRNEIAHRIHDLTFDASRNIYARETLEFSEVKYDYSALKRIKHYYVGILHRMQQAGTYTFMLSMNRFLFESAERTYDDELKRLHRKIETQYAGRRKRLGILKRELSLEGTGLTGEYAPAHPANQTHNGNLTKRGVEICYRLFDNGKRPIVVAHLMHISLKASRKRHKGWMRAGSESRTRLEF
jgi:hypothetical protein